MIDWSCLCPWCGGPATVTTNWRGERIGACDAYRPCMRRLGSLFGEEPKTWLVDRVKPWPRHSTLVEAVA